jgi:hypothetical protein
MNQQATTRTCGTKKNNIINQWSNRTNIRCNAEGEYTNGNSRYCRTRTITVVASDKALITDVEVEELQR